MRIGKVQACTARRNLSNVRVGVLQMLPLVERFDGPTTKHRNRACERFALDNRRLGLRRAVSNNSLRLGSWGGHVGINKIMESPIGLSKRVRRDWRLNRNERVLGAATTKHQRRWVVILVEEVVQCMLLHLTRGVRVSTLYS